MSNAGDVDIARQRFQDTISLLISNIAGEGELAGCCFLLRLDVALEDGAVFHLAVSGDAGTLWVVSD